MGKSNPTWSELDPFDGAALLLALAITLALSGCGGRAARSTVHPHSHPETAAQTVRDTPETPSNPGPTPAETDEWGTDPIEGVDETGRAAPLSALDLLLVFLDWTPATFREQCTAGAVADGRTLSCSAGGVLFRAEFSAGVCTRAGFAAPVASLEGFYSELAADLGEPDNGSDAGVSWDRSERAGLGFAVFHTEGSDTFAAAIWRTGGAI